MRQVIQKTLSTPTQARLFLTERIRRRTVGNVLSIFAIAAFVAALLYRTDGLEKPEPWAYVKTFTAVWSHRTNSIQLSITGNIHKTCHDIDVIKDVRPLEKGTAQENIIPVYGTLIHQLEAHPEGDFTAFDYARPEHGPLRPGEYDLRLLLLCQNSQPGTSDASLESNPVRAKIIVNKIPVRPISSMRPRTDHHPPPRS